ncbi:MAG: rhodanese-like domain-containing protein [Flavobacterium piscis]|nr:rhodanese-like domain-containing protein [Flavobacterium piscis]
MKMNKFWFVLALLQILFFSSCKNKPEEQIKASDKFEVLIKFLEENKDIVNSEDVPFYVHSDVVFSGLKKNFLIIDLRDSADFASGHINNSVNVLPENILDYFENRINPPAFDNIVLVCNTGFKSGFTSMCLRYLGYNNVFSLKYGLSEWNKSIAENYWLANIKDISSEEIDTVSHQKATPGKYPEIISSLSQPQDILYERVSQLLKQNYEDYFISIKDIIGNEDNYYLICYCPKDRYNKGHLKGSVQYEPKLSLKTNKDLNTLPIDKTIVLYDYTGFHASHAIVFLRILGYNAKALRYGSNSFIYSKIKEEETSGRYFSEEDIFDFPLKSNIKTEPIGPAEKSKKNNPKGGC